MRTLSPEQAAAVLAFAASKEQISVIDAGMVTGGSLRIAHEALAYLHQQQMLTALDQDANTLADPIRDRLNRVAQKARADQSTGPVTGQVEPWLLDVLETCKVTRKSAEIQDITCIKHRGTFQRNYLDRLLNEGLLVRTKPGKPRSRMQQYLTTDEGWALLAANQKLDKK